MTAKRKIEVQEMVIEFNKKEKRPLAEISLELLKEAEKFNISPEEIREWSHGVKRFLKKVLSQKD